jgi:glycosyltransferase involved in cell wall biosynthesis
VSDLPKVSVVIESVTARYDVKGGATMADDLAPTLEGVARQTYPRELIEAIVVLDRAVPASAGDEVRRRFPFVRFTQSPAVNYYAAKNAGVRAAGGSVVALLDGDCEPEAGWLESLVSRLEPGVGAVAGKTRYAEATRAARTLSVPGFSYVVGDETGAASGFNLNNVAFDRELLLARPLDERIRRNGGCYLLFHQLSADGQRIMYEPGAVVAHGVGDIRGWEFLRKHFGRGYDGVTVYRLDDEDVLRGSRLFRRFGVAALVAITARRILRDWWWLARHRRQIGIAGASLPYFGLVAGGIRMVELVGMLAAVVDPDRYASA